MKVIMIEDGIGCDDGIHAKTYKKGLAYELSNDLAKCFLDLSIAKLEDFTKAGKVEVAQEKALTAAPLNKAIKPSKNKGA